MMVMKEVSVPVPGVYRFDIQDTAGDDGHYELHVNDVREFANVKFEDSSSL